MMEHKSWLWKKKSIEKTMLAADKVNRGNEDELQGILAYEAELERNLNVSNENLSAALAEINAKDDIAKKQTNIAREAIQGWEKAEAEVLSLKQELEKTTQQMLASEERLHGLDAALKECMHQLRFVREEQEKRIHDAVIKTSREYEKSRIHIEEKLSESNKKLLKLTSENTQLTKALLAKEKLIAELHSASGQLESDLSSVMSRLETTQRDNASLSYEVRVLEKELEIRNEERDFNRRTAELAHKQHLESVKKIAKMETEAQRLRLLVRKRLPGPAALAKMKNEVEMLGKDKDLNENTRRRSNPFPIALKESSSFDTSGKQINFLTEQLCALEDENRVLKEILNRKTNEPSKIQFSIPASSDIGSDEKASMAESWAPSCKTVGASDIGLMDDFVEMEKLAIVSVEKPFTTTTNLVLESHSDWVENILKVISDHSRITQKHSTDILTDIISALKQKNDENTPEKKSVDETLLKKFDSDMNRSMERLIELIEGIKLFGKEDSSGYTVRVLQWKTSELGGILEIFLQTCNNLLNGKVEIEIFAKELTLTLEWIVNHCFSLQDVSSMRNEMDKHFDWDETRSETEVRISETDKLQSREESKKLKDDLENMESEKTDLERKLQSEVSKSESLVIQLLESERTIENLQMEVEFLKQEKDMIEDQIEVELNGKEDLDEQLIEAIGEYNEVRELSTSIDQDQHDHKSCSSEGFEARNLDEFVQPDSMVEEGIQNCELDDDEKKLQSVNCELDDDEKKLPSVNCELDDDEKKLKSEREIIAASEKLAECQETILNLGKQLKALASPRNTSIPDRVICNPTYEPPPSSPLPNNNNKTNHQRISLLDKMMAEDAARDQQPPTKPKEITRTITSPAIVMDDGNKSKNVKAQSPQRFLSVNGIKHQEEEEALVNFLTIVPNKKKKGGVLRKLLWRSKKGKK